MTIFKDRAFQEIISIKLGGQGGALIQCEWCPYKKRKRHQEDVHRAQATGAQIQKTAVCKPRAEASGESKPITTAEL